MRKYIIICLVVLTGLLLFTGVASAGPLTTASNVHGGYTADTSACGQCHNTHAAVGQNLIANLGTGNNDVYATCIYCHDGSGSKYDVANGAILGTAGTYAASGGGMSQMVATEGAAPVYAAVYSKHNTNQASGTTVWVPGYDTTVSAHMELTCASCHDPHNTANTARALRVNVNGVDISATPPDLTITVGTELENESISYVKNWNAFCGTCHQDYNQTAAGSGDANSGTWSTFKRHRVGMDPSTYPGVDMTNVILGPISQPSTQLPMQSVDGTAPNQQVMCLTCHNAHGTVKTSTVTFDRADGTTSTSSVLLRQNERGVCETCHAK